MPEPAAAALAPTSLPGAEPASTPALAPALATIPPERAGSRRAGAADPRVLPAVVRGAGQASASALMQPPDADQPVGGEPPTAPALAATAHPAKPSASAAAAAVPATPARSAEPAPPATSPGPDGPATTELALEPSADLAEPGALRSERPPSEPAGLPQRPSPPPPAVQVGVQLGVQLAAAGSRRIERLLIQLEPAALGRVEIRLEFSRDNRVSALIAADRHETLDLLQRDGRALERALQEAGLRLNDNPLSFSLRQEQRQHERGAGGQEPWPRSPAAAGPTDAAPAPEETRPLHWLGARRVLDIRI